MLHNAIVLYRRTVTFSYIVLTNQSPWLHIPRYWRDGINIYDGVLTIATTGIELMLALPNGFNDWSMVKYLLVLRVMRLTRLLSKINQYKVKDIIYYLVHCHNDIMTEVQVVNTSA